MADRRLLQRPNGEGGYYLEPMSDQEHAAFEAELARPDFEQAHGLDPVNFERTWTRQSGLCGTCVQPLAIASAFYEEDGGFVIVCAADSAILQIRADSARFGIESPV